MTDEPTGINSCPTCGRAWTDAELIRGARFTSAAWRCGDTACGGEVQAVPVMVWRPARGLLPQDVIRRSARESLVVGQALRDPPAPSDKVRAAVARSRRAVEER
jgi:hypothetical protein